MTSIVQGIPSKAVEDLGHLVDCEFLSLMTCVLDISIAEIDRQRLASADRTGRRGLLESAYAGERKTAEVKTSEN